MIAIKLEAAGREWAYQLREFAADLEEQGQGARARELARMASQTEREVASLHADGATAAADGWCGHEHTTLAEAFMCAGLASAREDGHADG